MLNFNWDSTVSPISCGRVVEVPGTLKRYILRNTISHTESNVLSSTDSCACTGTVEGSFPWHCRADNQANKRTKGKRRISLTTALT